MHSGYISEKFTNCIASNTIPVYWGGREVTRYFGDQCCWKLSQSMRDNMNLLQQIHDNHKDYLLDLTVARENLYEENAYLMKFLYNLWVKKMSPEFW